MSDYQLGKLTRIEDIREIWRYRFRRSCSNSRLSFGGTGMVRFWKRPTIDIADTIHQFGRPDALRP